ncbi:radical SAM protein [Marine Group I thaumarchaeote SCGC AAA799-B03]|uniref:Radical SAM protein n=1 Tax=Marine Group I thaumarchaeote SCGC AAA799-B03 TaxID=1502289 RepID=A0A087S7A9_9ARCH|nr:radical SAM protein [Marine Group I thaumarchaeote SCGC AAA799-B03]
MTTILGKEAELYEKLPDNKVKCTACARYCEIGKGQIGLCGIRGNENGKLQLYAYGKVISGHVDPIEKKPLIHYYPGSRVYSIATTGCNWLCKYCQNSDISQRREVQGIDMTPDEVVNTAIKYGVHGIAYTYNEPSIFIEFAKDCGIAARKKGLFNVFVSNGYDTPESVSMMNQFLDGITVDFKGSAEKEFTRKFIGVPDPQPIFDTLLEIRDETNIHIEITDLKKLSNFILDEFGPEMPIHFLRFHPDYKMMEYPSTPVETLEKHYQIAKDVGLKYVYLGNVPGHKWEHTYCSECNNIVVNRYGFSIREWNLDKNNCCKFCGNKIPIEGKLQEGYKEDRFQFVS